MASIGGGGDCGSATNSKQMAASLPNISDLTEFYKAAKNRFDTDTVFKAMAQTNVLQNVV
jgi:hypothetical protein